MKTLRVLFVLALIAGGFTHQAKAFRMVVIDAYSTNDIYFSPFNVAFSPCDPGETTAYTECFAGENLTGSVLTNLQIVVPNNIPDPTDPSMPDSVDCSSTFFASAVCTQGPGGTGYVLTFSGTGIPQGPGLQGAFFIEVLGATPDELAGTTASFNTPEPASIWLLSTGVLLSGLFFARQRRTLANPFA